MAIFMFLLFFAVISGLTYLAVLIVLAPVFILVVAITLFVVTLRLLRGRLAPPPLSIPPPTRVLRFEGREYADGQRTYLAEAHEHGREHV